MRRHHSLFTGEGVVYGAGTRVPCCRCAYDTFQCLDGWVFIECLGPVMFARVAGILGLDPAVYTYEAWSKDAAAVNSDNGREVDQRLRQYCAGRTALDVETTLNKAQIGCSRVYGVADQYREAHYRERDMTVPVVDHQSGVRSTSTAWYPRCH